MSEVMTIETAGAQLADAIKFSPEWRNFHEINAEFESDTEIGGLLAEYRSIVGRLQAAHNQDPNNPDLRRLEQIQVKVQQNPLFHQREEAADAMLAVLSQANAAITVALGVDFAANAQQQKGGCCGGGGSGGGGGGCCSH
jgi:cell fate (sporulation/competence/biofilm development) regulator YlbF (YheA/YmcA/DUF963 family)